jgi:gliding motility-associated-like protein
MRFFVRFIFVIIVLLLAGRNSYATHARAGEILFKQISLYTYEIEVIYYTESTSLANRDNVDIYFGDNTVQNVTLSYREQLKNSTFLNKYKTSHTYPGPGTYVIEFLDPNRIADIKNMDNSVNTPFYVETQLNINPFMGNNRSPILLQPPIDFAEINEIYVHNPNAYDPDGDSLVFSLIPPKQGKGTNVDNYSVPKGVRNGFKINSQSGEIIWDYPDIIGIFNIAILVEEYRHKKRIGYIIRDMQIIVKEGQNHTPVITPIDDICIEAGHKLTIPVHAYDIDVSDTITLTGNGGPFMQKPNPAIATPNPAQHIGDVYSTFSWDVSCEHIRKSPYMVVFKATDNHRLSPLADLEYFMIKVVGPAPNSLQTKVTTKGIQLSWLPPDTCSANPKAYYIYRKVDSSYWDTSKCETGVPSYTHFKLIDTTIGYKNTSYFDDNHGKGLIPGVEYCYRVTAIYLNDGNYEITEGYASNEVCAKLRKDVPVITHADVRKTDKSTGKIFIDWVKPVELDTNAYFPPYKYNILQSDNANLKNSKLLKTYIANSFYDLKAISLTDSFLDSENKPYSYKIEFYSTDSGSDYFVGTSQVASSIFLKLTPTHESIILDWEENVPWANDQYVIYRLNDVTNQYDSIDYTTSNTYKDINLVNGKTYCYKIQSQGYYSSTAGYINPILNFSEEACSFPIDTIKPCPPELKATAFCDPKNTLLNWQYYADSSCKSDIGSFRIYFSKQLTHDYVLIKELNNINQRSYLDNRSELSYSLAGSYVITAVDTFNNESRYSNEVYVDNCPVYILPNVFTPNNDGVNDTFHPLEGARFVEKINLTIYNRWGEDVFKTNDPYIRWDGKDQKKHKDCSNGVYFYNCEIFEIYLEGTKPRAIHGTITIFR